MVGLGSLEEQVLGGRVLRGWDVWLTFLDSCFRINPGFEENGEYNQEDGQNIGNNIHVGRQLVDATSISLLWAQDAVSLFFSHLNLNC
jgi:hypothetical protein